MGILRAFTSSLSYISDEQWKEFFSCDAMGPETLLVRAQKRVGSRSTNTRMDDQVITNGSLVIVNEGQAAIATANGKIIDVCTEPGAHQFFDPDHTGGVSGFFKDALSRVAYGGGDVQPLSHRLYYVNMMESTGNLFHTAAPVPIRGGDEKLGLDMDAGLMLSGVYSYKIVDPVLFYKLLVGNISGAYTRSKLNLQISTELLSHLQAAVGQTLTRISRPSDLPDEGPHLAWAIQQAADQGWLGQHGMAICSLEITELNLLDAAQVRQAQQYAVLKDPAMASARLTGAYSDALGLAAARPNPVMPRKDNDMVSFLRGGAPRPAGESSRSQPSSPSLSRPAGNRSDMVSFLRGESTKPEYNQAPQKWICSCGARNLGRFCTEC
ncbi:MAG: SPFH domain-containing protein, partial [Oscillospiraceae bacterium]|nr:SPFH domain-containing protein [Oscillospiraceae bacterium]